MNDTKNTDAMISVIVPVYNAEKYIERCAVSLFEQNMDNIEYIFVDDRGNDRSMDILKNVLKRYPQRKTMVKFVVHERNKGSMAARISGLEMAKGDYITFCDSDDWVDTDMYESMYRVAISNSSDFVWCDFVDEYSNRQVHRYEGCKQEADVLIKNILSANIHGGLWNKLVKRELYQKLDFRKLSGINIWEDLFITVSVLLEAQKISYINNSFYHYNLQNEDSLLSNLTEKKIEDRIIVCNSLDSLLKEKGVLDIFSNSIKHRKLWAKMELVTDSRFRNFERWRKLWPEAVEDVDNSNFSAYNKRLFKLVDRRHDTLAIVYIMLKDSLKKIIKK